MWSRWCVLFTLAAILSLGIALIEEIRLPDVFTECVDRHRSKSNSSATSWESVDNFCINKYRMNLARPYIEQVNISEDTTRWIDELLRMSSVESDEHQHKSSRHRRQVVGVPSVSGRFPMPFQSTLPRFPVAPPNPQQTVFAGFQTVPQQRTFQTVSQQGAFQTVPQQGTVQTVPQQGAFQTVPRQGSFQTVPQQRTFQTVPQQGTFQPVPQQVNVQIVPQSQQNVPLVQPNVPVQTVQQQPIPAQTFQQQAVPAQTFQTQNVPLQQSFQQQDASTQMIPVQIVQENVPLQPTFQQQSVQGIPLVQQQGLPSTQVDSVSHIVYQQNVPTNPMPVDQQQSLPVQVVPLQQEQTFQTQPQIAQPQLAQPQFAQPQVAQPQFVQPQVAQPQFAQPQVAQPLPSQLQPQPVQPQPAQPAPAIRQLRVRKEYRMLTDQERNDFHRAIQMLKADTSISPNRYDALCIVHLRLVNNIHHGSGFLPWHRVFITIFENALRQKVPSVALPYWDSTMDESLIDPTQSIMFSPRFLGNGNGLVTTGPFAYWQTPAGPLIRNIGQGGGSLFSRQEITGLLSRSRLNEIEEPDADIDFNIENIHGDVHTWIGGEMEPMETSAFDPVFFLHHCFVDFIWEIFRSRQRAMGIDPTTDYPTNFGGQTHAPSARMGFGDLQTTFGLSDMFTSQIYTYQQNPSCSVQNPICGSLYLSCDLSQGFSQCLPAATEVSNAAPAQAPPAPTQTQFGGVTPQIGQPSNIRRPMGLTPAFRQPMPVFAGRRKRASDRKNISNAKKSIEQNNKRAPVARGTHTCTGTWLSFSSQNRFEVNGVSDTRKWIFVPLKIISKRSPEHRKFHAFPIYDGKASRDHDIYNPEAYAEISPYFSEKVMPASPRCATRHDNDRTVGKVHIRSLGLNYHGNYEEYTVVDLRQAFSESTTYIAMKDPEDDMSEVMLTAYDSCGRRCKPYCRSNDPKSPGYHRCSGAIRVTNGTPWMYGKNYGDAVRMSWNFHSLTDIPELKADYHFVQFYCDHTN